MVNRMYSQNSVTNISYKKFTRMKLTSNGIPLQNLSVTLSGVSVKEIFASVPLQSCPQELYNKIGNCKK